MGRPLQFLLAASILFPLYSPAGIESSRVGVQVGHVAYKEDGVMEEKGFLGGIFGEVHVANLRELSISAFGSYVFGTLDYDSAPGSRLDLHSENPNTVLDLRLEAAYGLDIPVIDNVFVGTGYRRLTDDLQDIGDLKGYKRTQHYVYIPLGVQLALPSPDQWEFTAILEYDWFLKGYNETRQSDLEQNSGYGYRASLICDRALSSDRIRSIQLEPFVQYWNIGQSTLDKGLFEPKNLSTMLGIRAALQF